MNLVIIEGAGKKDTIKKYLGKDYIVFATKGHVRDLPAKTIAVDIKGDFSPKYVIMPDKKDIIKDLKAKAEKAEKIYIASDPDREGEAIAFHVAHILGIKKDEKCRVVFNEISKKAIEEALKQPRVIDQNLVDAQQARRVLDRLVGYKLSPVVSKKIKPKLSAGRVQSVALKLVVDREREIQNFKPQEYWRILAELEKQGEQPAFSALLNGYKGKTIKVANEKEAKEVEDNLKAAKYIIKKVTKKVTKSSPSAPFITSTMQQDALNKLGMDLRRTTMVAQSLYEGVKLPEGKTALVTYIRTDSVRVSADAIGMVREHILSTYGKDYLPTKPNFYKGKDSAQDAHEAIRPIDMSVTPDSVKKYVKPEEYKLYKLIYERFLASQMTDATFDSVTCEIEANDYLFKVVGKTPKFLGYTAAYISYLNEDEEALESEEKKKLPNLNEGDVLKLLNLTKEQKFTEPPKRYTEAMLVKTMEEKGIGRPATYTPTITLLAARKYTEKEKNRIKPTELGIALNDVLAKFFDKVIDVDFTARMEDKLDEVAETGLPWKEEVVAKFYNWFEKFLIKAGEDTSKVELTVEESDIPCDKCGALMVVRESRYGKFLACPNYPECKNIMQIPKKQEKPVAKCPDCGKDVFARKSRKGTIFYGCSGYPDCKFMSWGIPLEEKCLDCNSYLTKQINKNEVIIRCSNEKCNYKRTEPKPKNEEKQTDNE
jgi:DNA topoisomerase I